MRAVSPVISLSFATCLLASAPAHGLGFGRVANATQLGQPLDFSATIRFDGDEPLSRDCVFAEVTSGDVRVPPGFVRVSLGGSVADAERTVRVATSVPIDEPVVTVAVTVGCTSKVTRQFVAFVDPPGLALTPAAGTAAPLVAGAVPPAGEAGVRERPASTTTTAAPRPDGSARAASGRVADAADAARRPVRPAVARPAAGPRLQLDSPAPAPAAAPVVAAVEPSPAPPAAPASSADELALAQALARDRLRLQSLEDEMTRLRAESKAQKEAIASLRSQVGARRSQQYANPLFYSLAGLCLLLTTLICGLLGRRSRDRAAVRWLTSAMLARPADATPPAPVAKAPDADGMPPVDAPAARTEVEGDDRARPATAGAGSTTPGVARGPASASEPVRLAETPVAGAAALPPARPLSVEELIDLEQQADFFVVLGQDDAAIELLASRVGSDGPTWPAPLLKLLEIHRRLGERADFERVRNRVDRYFNVRVPEFDAGPGHGGRALDAHPVVVARLQALWPTPAQALDAIDTLVVRRGSAPAVFDLAAFGELLFLQSIARDNVGSGSGSGAVDLLLPFGAGPRAASKGPSARTGGATPDVELDSPPARPLATPVRPAPLAARLPVLTAAASPFDAAETVPAALRRPPDYANDSVFVDLELEFPSSPAEPTLQR